jgi:hypothetical protein
MRPERVSTVLAVLALPAYFNSNTVPTFWTLELHPPTALAVICMLVFLFVLLWFDMEN